jgi:lipopolysaccharide export system protein LptA
MLKPSPIVRPGWLPGLLLACSTLPAAAMPALPAAGESPPPAPSLPAPASMPAAPPAAGVPAVPAQAPTGLVTIESDQQQADNATGIVTATGNVRIVYPDRRVVATARQAQYFTRESRIVLSGDVDVVQEGGNRIRAERVVYLVETERALAQPEEGQQVFSQLRLQLQPGGSAPAAPQPGTAAP